LIKLYFEVLFDRTYLSIPFPVHHLFITPADIRPVELQLT
jgi:hypothetical protein